MVAGFSTEMCADKLYKKVTHSDYVHPSSVLLQNKLATLYGCFPNIEYVGFDPNIIEYVVGKSILYIAKSYL